jgi:threonine dehydratase
MNFPKDVDDAVDRICTDVRRTPLEASGALGRSCGACAYIKWENEQITGSFKFRGALNRMRTLTPSESRAGVVSASTGNHGLAVALAAKIEGVKLTLFLPETAVGIKRRKIEAVGVIPVLYGGDCEKTEAHARRAADEAGKVFISPYNDPAIVAGQGTIAIEILEELPGVDAVIVPIGGGGLIAGIAGFIKAVSPRIRVIGVEPETSAFMKASMEAGALVEIREEPTIADAVAGGIEAGSITYPLCREFVDEFVTVPEEGIIRAMRLVFEHHGKMIEGAGALAVAGLLGLPGAFQGKTVVCLASGGNVDPALFGSVTVR